MSKTEALQIAVQQFINSQRGTYGGSKIQPSAKYDELMWISYDTTIAFVNHGDKVLTINTEKYSATTSRQQRVLIEEFMKAGYGVCKVNNSKDLWDSVPAQMYWDRPFGQAL